MSGLYFCRDILGGGGGGGVVCHDKVGLIDGGAAGLFWVVLASGGLTKQLLLYFGAVTSTQYLPLETEDPKYAVSTVTLLCVGKCKSNVMYPCIV